MANHAYAVVNHRLESVTYADDTARLAATGFPISATLTTPFVPADIGRVCRVASNGCYWRLSDDSPITWEQIINPALSVAAGYSVVQNEGSALTGRNTLNFIGSGVDAVDNGGSTRTDVTIPGIALLNNGAATTYRSVWNIVNASSIADNPGAGRIDITLPSGGGGGGAATSEPFIVYQATAGLSAERVFAIGGNGLAWDVSTTTLSLDATLQALSQLNNDLGAVVQTGIDTFSKVALGTTTANDILRRSDGDSRYLIKSSNLSDLGSVGSARTNLGLGSAAVADIGTNAANVPSISIADARYAPIGAQYVVLSANGALTAESVLAVTAPIALAGSTISLADLGISTAKLANNSATNAKLAQVPTMTMKGNNTGGTADVKDLNLSEIAAMLANHQGQQIYNYKPKFVTYTGDTTLSFASDNGCLVIFNSASDVDCTISTSLGAGFNCSIIQLGAGIVNFVEGPSMNIWNSFGHTMTAGQWAIVNVLCIDANNAIITGITDM